MLLLPLYPPLLDVMARSAFICLHASTYTGTSTCSDDVAQCALPRRGYVSTRLCTQDVKMAAR